MIPGGRFAAASILLGLTLTGLVACGGSGGGELSGGGHVAGYAYVASTAGQGQAMRGAVLQYSIDSSGSLASLGVVSVPTGLNPVAMGADPTGHYVYVANQGDATISQYSVGAGGGLVALSPATVSIPGIFPSVASYSVSINPDGRFLYVVINPRDPPVPDTAIVEYAIGNDGALSPLTPADEIGVAVTDVGPLVFDPSGSYAYLGVVGGTEPGGVFEFSVGSNGELTPVAFPLPLPLVPVSRNINGITFSPGGQTVYLLSACVDDACDGEITQYTVGQGGILTQPGTPMPTGSHVIPISLVTDTSGASAYLLTNLMGIDTNAGALYQFTINSSGALVPDTPPSVNLSSGAVAQAVHGPNLYALSSNAIGFASGAPTGGHIDLCSIGTGGLLTTKGSVIVSGGYPTALTIVAAH